MFMSQETNQSENQTTPHEEILSPALCEGDKTLRAAVGTSAGASPCNTAPCKYTQEQSRHICPLRCALDSLYLSFHGTTFEKVEDRLFDLKNIAQGNSSIRTSQAFYQILDHQFEVKAKGSGKFAYVLEDNWFRIEVSSAKSKKLPLAYVQIRSELLTFQPLKVIIKMLKKIIHLIGDYKDEPRISRLDMCLDLYTTDHFSFEQINEEQWKTKAMQISAFYTNKKCSGYSIGKGDIVGRIYNKLLEIKLSGKEYLFPLWKEEGWNGEQDVWRVEFQFRRAFLQEANILFLSDYLLNRQNLWHYASQHWLQLVQPNDQDSNPSRWPVHPAWQEIANACSCTEPKRLRRVTKERIPSNHYLFVAGFGAITSFMAREGITDIGEAFGEYWQQAEEFHKQHKGFDLNQYLQSKVEEKAKRFNKIQEK
jgi:hypothetical protein